MTYRDSFKCVTWLIHMCDVTRTYVSVSHPYVSRDSFICVTWLVHMCHTRVSLCHRSTYHVQLLSCDMTHSYVWNESCACVTWHVVARIIYMCNGWVTWHNMNESCHWRRHLTGILVLICHCNRLRNAEHAATRCNTLQHAATRCNTPLHIATHCTKMQLIRYGNAQWCWR